MTGEVPKGQCQSPSFSIPSSVTSQRWCKGRYADDTKISNIIKTPEKMQNNSERGSWQLRLNAVQSHTVDADTPRGAVLYGGSGGTGGGKAIWKGYD